jgi:hypothetical protein
LVVSGQPLCAASSFGKTFASCAIKLDFGKRVHASSLLHRGLEQLVNGLATLAWQLLNQSMQIDRADAGDAKVSQALACMVA